MWTESEKYKLLGKTNCTLITINTVSKYTRVVTLPVPHLSPHAALARRQLVGSVRAGAVRAHVGAEPIGQPLGLDGQPELLFNDGREVGEVVQGESAGRGKAGNQGGAADVSQGRT